MKQLRMGPVVGISVSLDRGKKVRAGAEYYYVRRAYAEQVRKARAVPILLTLDTPVDEACELCDALLVTGGDNLPAAFEASACEPPEALVEPGVANPEESERVLWDRRLLEAARERARPVLGICYGMQLINLHYGGSLYTDLERQHPGVALDHGGTGRVAEHDVALESDSVLWHTLPRRLSVNSSHCQAIRRVAPGFTVTARSSDGVIEAIEGPYCYGIEWHPETHPASQKLLENFVDLLGREP